MILKPDPIDPRDWLYVWNRAAIVPAKHTLAERIGAIEDQGPSNSCTANALVSICEMFVPGKDYSRLFNYYLSRQLYKGMVVDDMGCTARFALRAAQKFGMALESFWPFDLNNLNTQPDANTFGDAITRQIGAYYRISDMADARVAAVKHALASGHPVYWSMHVSNKFAYLRDDSIVPHLTDTGNGAYGGMHQVVIIGYDEESFYIENSWGTGWANNGIGRISYECLKRDTVDTWVVTGFDGATIVGENMVTFDPVRAQIIRDYLAQKFAPIVSDAKQYECAPEEIDKAMSWPVGTAAMVLGVA